jgi:hypothetical protein
MTNSFRNIYKAFERHVNWVQYKRKIKQHENCNTYSRLKYIEAAPKYNFSSKIQPRMLSEICPTILDMKRAEGHRLLVSLSFDRFVKENAVIRQVLLKPLWLIQVKTKSYWQNACN